jgi:hypothetical protein
MLLVVASRQDQNANELVARWAPRRATLLACEDLCHHGWQFDPGNPERGWLVAGGSVMAVSGITGVLTRRRHIFGVELTEIAIEDRPYVAAEINAFLVAWLSSLRCPVINRPSGISLCGPSLRAEQWVCLAASVGIRVKPARRKAYMGTISSPALSEVQELSEVIVVGEHWFGLVDDYLGALAVRLARAAGAELLSITFDQETFAGASSLPVLNSEPVIGAVLERLEARYS